MFAKHQDQENPRGEGSGPVTIAQARDKQVEENQDQSMKGCSVNSERC